MGKSSLVPVPYEWIQKEPGCVVAHGLPDGVGLKKPSEYDTKTLMKILEQSHRIQFTVKRWVCENTRAVSEFPLFGSRKAAASRVMASNCGRRKEAWRVSRAANAQQRYEHVCGWEHVASLRLLSAQHRLHRKPRPHWGLSPDGNSSSSQRR